MLTYNAFGHTLLLPKEIKPMWTLNLEQYTALLNQARELTIEQLSNAGMLSTSRNKAMSNFVFVVHKKGTLGNLWSVVKGIFIGENTDSYRIDLAKVETE